MSKKQFFEAVCRLKHETEKAILVVDGDNEYWLPKSQVSFEHDPNSPLQDMIIVTAPEWLLKEKGML